MNSDHLHTVFYWCAAVALIAFAVFIVVMCAWAIMGAVDEMASMIRQRRRRRGGW